MREKLLTTEKVTTSEEVDKGTKQLDNTKEAVLMIHRKDLDKFEGKYKGSTGWFNPDHVFKGEIFLHFNRTSIYIFMKGY